jgi:phosphoadenosine phosphosulfate reductase
MMTALAFSGGKDSMACLHLMRDTLDCAIYVDTGFAYPETQSLVAYAETMVHVHTVQADRAAQNAQYGLPADVVPINWTAMGQQMTSRKPVMVQSYLQCCWENIAVPLTEKAKALGVTHLVSGQRMEEGHKSTSRHGDVVDGLVRLYPIHDWTTAQVLAYLATQMTVPDHYCIAHSSLDCYDCTAFAKDSQDRVAWTKARYPAFYAAYAARNNAVLHAIQEAL